MSDKVSGGGVMTKTKRVFLVSGTANAGWWVNYNFDAVNVAAENQTLANASEIRWCDARRVQVEYPDTWNYLHGAGVIDKSSDGVVGPNWINIHEPGSICPVSVVSAVCSSGYGTQSTGQFLTYTIATSTIMGSAQSGQFNYTGFPGIGSAIILNEGLATTLKPNKLSMAELMTGPQSGGVQTVAWHSTFTANSDFTWHGLTLITATTTLLSADCSLSIPSGRFFGQRKMFYSTTATATAVSFNVESANFASPVTSIAGVATGTTTAVCGVMSGIAIGSLAAAWVDMTWNGYKWTVQSYNAISA